MSAKSGESPAEKGAHAGQGGAGKSDLAHTFTIYIDGEPYEVNKGTTTPSQLLQLAGLAVSDYYITQIHGASQESYQGKANVPIHLHEKARFSTVFVGATTVSDGSHQQRGALLFAQQLRDLGYDVTELPDGHVAFEYLVEVGKFSGRKVTHGLVIPPDFPFTPPSGPHVSPHLHPCGCGGQHPLGGIHESRSHSKHFQDGWQYWSRPFRQWSALPRKGAAAYMSFIRGLWAAQ